MLIAEDNEVNAIIAKAFLEKFGHKVKHVENGALAVEAVEEGWADLILMDVHMPVMNGIDATKAIRLTQQGKKLPIIGLTAEAFAERHVLFKEAGMNGVLTKPFTEQQLADIIAAHPVADRRLESRNDGPAIAPGAARGAAADAIDTGNNGGPADTQATSCETDLYPTGDLGGLKKFRDQLGSETVSTLLNEAQKSLRKQLVDLRDGLQTGDATRIREAAHAIKGGSGSLFATHIAKLAADIERNAADIDTVRGLMPAFENAATDAIAWWREQAA
ncbi:MAG: response regulator [Rhodospirillales bacterium]|nr:response regulator [Rhodospirillales bacterium]